jgi:hypothetical protein
MRDGKGKATVTGGEGRREKKRRKAFFVPNLVGTFRCLPIALTQSFFREVLQYLST